MKTLFTSLALTLLLVNFTYASNVNTIHISDLELKIYLPKDCIYSKSDEYNRAGSIVSFDIECESDNFELSELMISNLESIRSFQNKCDISNDCFFGPWVDENQYKNLAYTIGKKEEHGSYNVIYSDEHKILYSYVKGFTMFVDNPVSYYFLQDDLLIQLYGNLLISNESEFNGKLEILNSVILNEFTFNTIHNSNIFNDVSTTHQNLTAITYAKDQGIVQGYADGTYRPNNNINRAEFTKIVVEAALPDVTKDCDFNILRDIPANSWYEEYLKKALCAQLIAGYPDGTFKPENNVNAAEVAKIIAKAFNLPITSSTLSEWFIPYVDALKNINAWPDSINSYSKAITRGEMTEIIYRVMERDTLN